MRFRMIDEILELVPGARISAVKRLRADEDYLQDHFPQFPVMPGVLMLEALFQAGLWLVLKTDDFAQPVIRLKEARNIKYADFVKPGQELLVTCDWVKQDGPLVTLAGQGTVAGGTAVSGRMILERVPLAEHFPTRTTMESFCRQNLRQELDRLFPRPFAASHETTTQT